MLDDDNLKDFDSFLNESESSDDEFSSSLHHSRLAAARKKREDAQKEIAKTHTDNELRDTHFKENIAQLLHSRFDDSGDFGRTKEEDSLVISDTSNIHNSNVGSTIISTIVPVTSAQPVEPEWKEGNLLLDTGATDDIEINYSYDGVGQSSLLEPMEDSNIPEDSLAGSGRYIPADDLEGSIGNSLESSPPTPTTMPNFSHGIITQDTDRSVELQASAPTPLYAGSSLPSHTASPYSTYSSPSNDSPTSPPPTESPPAQDNTSPTPPHTTTPSPVPHCNAPAISTLPSLSDSTISLQHTAPQISKPIQSYLTEDTLPQAAKRRMAKRLALQLPKQNASIAKPKAVPKAHISQPCLTTSQPQPVSTEGSFDKFIQMFQQ